MLFSSYFVHLVIDKPLINTVKTSIMIAKYPNNDPRLKGIEQPISEQTFKATLSQGSDTFWIPEHFTIHTHQ